MRALAKREKWLALVLGACGWILGAGVESSTITHLEFLGEARISGDLIVDETPVGGLSAIAYDATHDKFYVVSDDPSARAAARFYTIKLDLSQGLLGGDGAEVTGMTRILTPDGEPIAGMTVDPEGLVLHPDGSLYFSSEGQINRQVAPLIWRISRGGEYLGELSLPDKYRPVPDGSRGPRHNLVFESLAVTPDGRFLIAALENALAQDGPRAAIGVPSPSRMLRFDLEDGRLDAEYIYMADPVATPASISEGLEVSGLVELLALDQEHLLAMERSYSMGVGNSIKLYLVSIAGATDVQSHESLEDVDMSSATPVRKDLLLDLAELGIYLDNLEGMTLGPTLADGRRTLVLVSDNNFSPLIQTTQLLAFALGGRSVDIEGVQGAGHRSPLEDRWVRGVEGVVTGLYPGREEGFWMESTQDDGNLETSRGLLVMLGANLPTVALGDQVVVHGRVQETQYQGDLSVTSIRASSLRIDARGLPLPSPVTVGRDGLEVPTEVVDDDSLRFFEPRFDGIDFWESLEGMRIAVSTARVVGPTSVYNELVVDASGNPNSTGRSRHGGLMMRPGDLNPERLTVKFSSVGEVPNADVGAHFDGDLIGVVGYSFGGFRLHAQAPVPRILPASHLPEKTELVPASHRLTVASFNVRNLSAESSEAHFQTLARDLVVALKGPDIVALQEIQDNNGPVDDGNVLAHRTLDRLVAAIGERGGPKYEYRQIDPLNNGDGGRPGSNIRVAFLFNPSRVSFADIGQAGPLDDVELIGSTTGVALSASPGRIAARAYAFNGDEVRGFSGSRKSLIGQFQFAGNRVFVVNNHWTSKTPDTRVFGDVQPPVRRSEDQRSQQARLVGDFVSSLLSLDPEAAILVVGDFNDHEFRTPLRVLETVPLKNLVYQLDPEDRYTFNFKGVSQTLDHILMSGALLERAGARLDIVHLNTDYAHEHRSSDHDPLVVELDFSPAN